MRRDANALRDLESSAAYTPGFLLSDGRWADVNYDDTPDGSWSPWDHFRRLTMMAKAYRTPGQALYNDPLLRAEIESALALVPSFYGVSTLPLGNWWFWTIGAPLDLGPTLVLMRGDIGPSVYDECVRTLAFHIGSSPTGRGLVGPLPVDGAFVIGALSGSGIMSSHVAAELLAAHVTNTTLPDYAPAFLPSRYDAPEYLDQVKRWGALTGQL